MNIAAVLESDLDRRPCQDLHETHAGRCDDEQWPVISVATHDAQCLQGLHSIQEHKRETDITHTQHDNRDIAPNSIHRAVITQKFNHGNYRAPTSPSTGYRCHCRAFPVPISSAMRHRPFLLSPYSTPSRWKGSRVSLRPTGNL